MEGVGWLSRQKAQTPLKTRTWMILNQLHWIRRQIDSLIAALLKTVTLTESYINSPI